MKKRSTGFILITLGLTVILNILAWKSTRFCDFYVYTIYPVWQSAFGHLSDLSSKSVGEIMIALYVILIALAIISGMGAVIFLLITKIYQKERLTSFVTGYKKVIGIYYRILFCVSAFTALVLTLNCFIMYHCSTFKDKYLSEMLLEHDDYSVEELTLLRDYVVTQVNQYSKKMERDERGVIVYNGNMEEEAIRSMQALGELYPQLAGYYTIPKQIKSSEFLSQQYMRGYYFPFSMEANYNGVMYIMCRPSTMCHELAHTKGFIYEDEANLISFLACINSDDIVFQYSGYLSVLNYIDNDFKESIDYDKNIYYAHAKISPQVKRDNVFLTKDAWVEVEKKAVVKTETVKKASNTFIESNLVLNGVKQGKASYSEVVGLLMDYYSCSTDEFLHEQYVALNE